MDLNKIEISQIADIIPNLLLKKLLKLEILNAHDILQIDISIFTNNKGIGSKVKFQLIELQNWIQENHENLLEAIKKTDNYIIDLDKNPELKKIEFSKISSLLPKKLLSKFNRHNIFTLADLSNFSKKDFFNLDSIGKSVMNLLNDFIFDLQKNPNFYLQSYLNNSNGFIIPNNIIYNDKIDILFKKFIDDYLEILNEKESRDQRFIVRYFGLQNNNSYVLSDIGLYYGVTRERVRQVIDILLQDLKEVLSGKKSSIINIRCDQNFKLIINSFIQELQKEKILSEKKFIEKTKINLDPIFNDDLKPYLKLLFEIYGFKASNNQEFQYTNEVFYFFDPLIDKAIFFKLLKNVQNILIESVIPIEEFDLIIRVRKKNKEYSVEDIKIIIEKVSYIEILSILNKTYIQISLNKLSSSGDIVERILFEKGKGTHIDELINEANKRLFHLGVNKVISKNSILRSLKLKNNILHKGKTGIYSFVDWEENSDLIKNLIKKALLYYDKPLNHKEIIEFVKQIRQNIKENSIRTVTNLYFIRLKGNSYILPDWKKKYNNQIIKKTIKDKQNKTRLQEIIEIFRNQPGEVLLHSELVNQLKNIYSIPTPTIYSILNKKCFNKAIDDNGNLVISLDTSSKLLEFKNLSQKEIIINASLEFLKINNEESTPLNKLVTYLQNSLQIRKQNVYKIISENSIIFKKKSINNLIYISIRKTNQLSLPSNQDNWELIKQSLERELSEIFEDPKQPRYSKSLHEAIDLFKKTIELKIDEADLDGLSEQLIPALFKFYCLSNDRTDLLNNFKQVSISLDPYLQRVLFILDEQKYRVLKIKKSGLGKFIKELEKLDPNEFRYKEHIKDVPIYKFSKHMYVSYNSRNNLAHTAKKWSKNQIISSITSTITIYIFTIFEYYFEIEKRVLNHP